MGRGRHGHQHLTPPGRQTGGATELLCASCPVASGTDYHRHGLPPAALQPCAQPITKTQKTMSTIHFSFFIRGVCQEFGRIMRPSATENSSVCRRICRIIRPAIRPSATESHSACRLFALFGRVLALTLSCSLALACQRVTLTDEDNPPSSSTPTVTHREEVLLATNDTARFYLSGTEISNIRLNLYPHPDRLHQGPALSPAH